jgi:uncharacterized protein with HEPN domain
VSGEHSQLQFRLLHMLTAIDTFAGYLERGEREFMQEGTTQDAISYQLIVLGEAAKDVDRYANQHGLSLGIPDLSPIARMRDFLAHQYWRVDGSLVWRTATESLPSLRTQVSEALRVLEAREPRDS